MNPVQNEKGEWVIPASRRPDGTWRKEKLLKEGYVPQDEVRAFETRASKQTGKKGIPGLPPTADKPKVMTTPKKKTEQKPVIADTSEQTVLSAMLSAAKITPPTTTPTPAAEVAEKDPQKRLKALKKKLRDILELQTKNLAELSHEQTEKLGKKESIEAEIAFLTELGN